MINVNLTAYKLRQRKIMNNKDLFNELADQYLPKCTFCNDRSCATHTVSLISNIVPLSIKQCCVKHLKEAAEFLRPNITDIAQIKIHQEFGESLYRTVLFLDTLDDVSKSALSDLEQYIPICDDCGIGTAIYQGYIPCAFDSEEYLCKSCGLSLFGKDFNGMKYELKDLPKQEYIIELIKILNGE